MTMRMDAGDGDGDVVAAYPFRWRADEARRCLGCPRGLTDCMGGGLCRVSQCRGRPDEKACAKRNQHE